MSADVSAEVDFDVLIVGGGMVGATLAYALRECALRVVVVEAFSSDSHASPSFDDRSSALSFGSRRILEAFGLWTELSALVEPIRVIQVSDKGFWGAARLTADEMRVDALGYVVENREFGRVLNACLAVAGVQVFCPAMLVGMEVENSCVRVSMRCGQEQRVVSARLVVAADGAHSTVRDLLNVKSLTKSYEQAAVIANVQVQRGLACTAFERFTASGPLAFLPMREYQGWARYSVVWTILASDVARVQALDDAAFLSAVQAELGYRLGRLLKVGRRVVYPLALSGSAQGFAARTVFVGNAMQALHPVAGQGFNLGLRDIFVLQQWLSASAVADVGCDYVLREFTRLRRGDREATIRRTDGWVRLFSSACVPLGVVRGLALSLVDGVPLLQQPLARASMGLGVI